MPSGALLRDMEETFGSFSKFKSLYAEALKVFGSGWTYLVYNRQGKLKIVNLKTRRPSAAEGEACFGCGSVGTCLLFEI